jgi:hypothetical protein
MYAVFDTLVVSNSVRGSFVTHFSRRPTLVNVVAGEAGCSTAEYRGKLLCYTTRGLDILKTCEIGEEV